MHTTVSDGNNANFLDVQELVELRFLDDSGLGSQSQLAVLAGTTLEDAQLLGGKLGEDGNGLRNGLELGGSELASSMLVGSGLGSSGLGSSGLGSSGLGSSGLGSSGLGSSGLESSGLGVGASSLGGRLNRLIALALLVEDLGHNVGGNGSKRIVGVLLEKLGPGDRTGVGCHGNCLSPVIQAVR
jgi:hypothetical protein